jgi:hypothetical protein
MAMHTPRINFYKAIIVFILLNLCLLSGCGNEPASNQNTAKNVTPNSDAEKSNQASDNVADLLNIVRLPVVPDEVVWREDTNVKPKKITAVLKFEKEELPNFTAIIEKERLSDSVEVGVENWFPQELTAQSQLSGEGVLKGTAYSAKEFYNIPYGNGRITRINGTDFFVLELTADN